MKAFITLFFVAAIIAGCADETTVSSKPGGGQPTTIEWADTAKDYGRITEGQKLSVSFKFRNTGTSPLVIHSVSATCGCTVADYPRQPIAPGKEGEITGEFNSEGREGHQQKKITVRSSAVNGEQDLSFEVYVAPKPNKSTQ